MSNCNSCPSKNSCKSQATCNIKNNPNNNIKKIIAVMSGKGGVGKSTVTALIAKKLNKMGYKVGILDSDITGPSIPRLMNLQNQRAMSNGKDIFPIESKEGIKTMSINYMVDNENQPIVWKGPMVGNAVKQFYSDVIWGELDYLLIDMPPGTGDVALTVMQSIPISGVVMVSVPQDMISMIVSKSINMARKMNIEVLGVIENMSYIQCPDCNKKIRMFDGENTEKFLKDMNVDLLGELPMHKSIVNYSIAEQNEDILDLFDPIIDKIISKCKKKIIL